MAKFQVHLPKPVCMVGPVQGRQGEPLAVSVLEAPARTEVTPSPAENVVQSQSSEELRLREELTRLEQEVGLLVRGIDHKLEEFKVRQEQERGELQQLAVRLAIIATRAVLQQVSSESDQRLEQLITDGVAQIPAGEAVTVRLHPSQSERLAYHFESISSQRNLRFVSDPAIPAGEVQLESSLFSLTSSLSEQLRQMEQALGEELLH